MIHSHTLTPQPWFVPSNVSSGAMGTTRVCLSHFKPHQPPVVCLSSVWCCCGLERCRLRFSAGRAAARSSDCRGWGWVGGSRGAFNQSTIQPANIVPGGLSPSAGSGWSLHKMSAQVKTFQVKCGSTSEQLPPPTCRKLLLCRGGSFSVPLGGRDITVVCLCDNKKSVFVRMCLCSQSITTCI